jgi:hypothetical protein
MVAPIDGSPTPDVPGYLPCVVQRAPSRPPGDGPRHLGPPAPLVCPEAAEVPVPTRKEARQAAERRVLELEAELRRRS